MVVGGPNDSDGAPGVCEAKGSEVAVTLTEENRARIAIEYNGESVIYRGVQWWYLRTPLYFVERAAKRLEEAGKLVRWSEKTPRLVRLVED